MFFHGTSFIVTFHKTVERLEQKKSKIKRQQQQENQNK